MRKLRIASKIKFLEQRRVTTRFRHSGRRALRSIAVRPVLAAREEMQPDRTRTKTALP